MYQSSLTFSEFLASISERHKLSWISLCSRGTSVDSSGWWSVDGSSRSWISGNSRSTRSNVSWCGNRSIGWRCSGSISGRTRSDICRSGWGSVDWCSGGIVGRTSRIRVRWLVFRVFSLAFVFYVRDVSVAVRSVINYLCAAVGESNTIRAGDDISVASLRMSEVVVRSIVFNVPWEGVGLRRLKIISCYVTGEI